MSVQPLLHAMKHRIMKRGVIWKAVLKIIVRNSFNTNLGNSVFGINQAALVSGCEVFSQHKIRSKAAYMKTMVVWGIVRVSAIIIQKLGQGRLQPRKAVRHERKNKLQVITPLCLVAINPSASN